MAEGFIFRQQFGVVDASEATLFDGLFFDVSESETHTFRSEVTRYPVEDGSVISDHVIQWPDSLSARVTQSDTPIVARTEQFKKRGQEAFDLLLKFKQEATILNVVTAFRIYQKVVISQIVVTRDAASGEAVCMDVDFEQMIVVDGGVPDSEDTDVLAALAQLNKGKQTLTPAAAAVTAEINDKTLILQAAQGVANVLTP